VKPRPVAHGSRAKSGGEQGGAHGCDSATRHEAPAREVAVARRSRGDVLREPCRQRGLWRQDARHARWGTGDPEGRVPVAKSLSQQLRNLSESMSQPRRVLKGRRRGRRGRGALHLALAGES